MVVKKLFFFLSLFFVSTLISACTELSIGKTVGDFTLEDRPFGSSVMDSKTEISLKSDLFDYNHTFPVKVSLMVSERRALIVGNMDSQEEIDAVERIIWKNPYITEVYNYLELTENGIVDSSKDFLLSKAVRLHLIGAEGVTSSNYKTLVNNKIVYVLGYAESAKEKDLMLQTLQKVTGLRRIVPFVIIVKKEK
jgi:osmotically-inducible protein OsmY